MIDRQHLHNELFVDNAKRFAEHMLVSNNERIIFSGRFGTGKTTFLNEFFLEDNQRDHYRKVPFKAVRIYPVNYSIASNEDIFEYIKHDVLVEMLLAKNYKFDSVGLNYWQNAAFDLKSHPAKFISSILTMIPKIGKPGFEVSVKEIFDSLKNLKDQLDNSYERNKVKLDELLKVQDALYKEVDRKGSLYEADSITELIRTVLNRSEKRAANGDKTVEDVLIIDDLDRIDPEHIFRILNVFAAHFDTNSNLPNKFGFDKVILVCDINNIRKIFSTKFGVDTDFNGYIDKFYSTRVFEYSIRDRFARIACKTIFNTNWASNEIAAIQDNICDDIKRSPHIAHETFNNVIEMLVANDQLNIRNIKRYEKIGIFAPSTIKNNTGIISVEENAILLRLYQLSHILGNFTLLREAIIKSTKPFKIHGDLTWQTMLMIMGIYQIPFYGNDDKEYEYNINGRKVYVVVEDGVTKFTDKKQSELVLSIEEYKSVLLDTIDFLSNSDIHHYN